MYIYTYIYIYFFKYVYTYIYTYTYIYMHTHLHRMAVFIVIRPDNELIQVYPASVFFMVLSWIGTSYNSYNDIIQIMHIYMQTYKHDDFAAVLARKMAKTVCAHAHSHAHTHTRTRTSRTDTDKNTMAKTVWVYTCISLCVYYTFMCILYMCVCMYV